MLTQASSMLNFVTLKYSVPLPFVMLLAKKQMLISLAVLALSVARAVADSDVTCYINAHKDAPYQQTMSLPYNQNGTSWCRSVAVEIESLDWSGDVDRLTCYDQWGCAGRELFTVHSKEDTIPDQCHSKSCRFYPTNPLPYYGKVYSPTPAVYQPPYVHSSGTTPTPAPAPSNSTTFSAVLFDECNYMGIKHWIDGTVGECRGLSGVPVYSVEMVAYPGADPVANPASRTDDVTLAFFDQYGCQGNLIMAVTGQQGNLSQSIKYIQGFNGQQSNVVQPASHTDGVSPLSVRFVRTGIQNQYYSMEYDGASGTTSAAPVMLPDFLVTVATALIAISVASRMG